LSEVTSLTIPATVTDIGGAAFSGSGIAQFTVDGSSNFTTDGSMLLSGITLLAYPAASGKITISGNIAIGPGAFAGSALTSLKVTGAVTSIGAGAFKDCLSLEAVSLPSSITNIGDEAFAGCSALQEIEIPVDTPPSLGTEAFDGVHEEIKIIVPASQVTAYQIALNWQAYSAHIQGPPVTPSFSSLEAMKSYLDSAEGGTSKDKPIKVALEVSLSSFESSADPMLLLYNALPLYSAESPKFVSVDLSACTGQFGSGQNYNTRTSSFNNLAAIILPVQITSTPPYMFRNCANLVTVDLSSCNNLTAIPMRMFFGCSALETIDLSGCVSLATIGDHAFRNTGLKEITLGSSVKTVGDNAFYGCPSLKWVKWPASAASATIGGNCFSAALDYVELPANISSISTSAFTACTLKVLVLHASNPSSISSNCFSWDSSYAIYVPDDAVSAYQAASGWSSLQANIKGLSELGLDDPDNW
jgi:hypothetical protein